MEIWDTFDIISPHLISLQKTSKKKKKKNQQKTYFACTPGDKIEIKS